LRLARERLEQALVVDEQRAQQIVLGVVGFARAAHDRQREAGLHRRQRLEDVVELGLGLGAPALALALEHVAELRAVPQHAIEQRTARGQIEPQGRRGPEMAAQRERAAVSIEQVEARLRDATGGLELGHHELGHLVGVDHVRELVPQLHEQPAQDRTVAEQPALDARLDLGADRLHEHEHRERRDRGVEEKQRAVARRGGDPKEQQRVQARDDDDEQGQAQDPHRHLGKIEEALAHEGLRDEVEIDRGDDRADRRHQRRAEHERDEARVEEIAQPSGGGRALRGAGRLPHAHARPQKTAEHVPGEHPRHHPPARQLGHCGKEERHRLRGDEQHTERGLDAPAAAVPDGRHEAREATVGAPRQEQADRLRKPPEERQAREPEEEAPEVVEPEVEAEHPEQHELIAPAVAQHHRRADREGHRGGQK
jgi:hypothetical protein